jgi:hypothetical protein
VEHTAEDHLTQEESRSEAVDAERDGAGVPAGDVRAMCA